MLASHALGLIGVVLVMLLWVVVQGAWRKVFAAAGTDPDVLAGRMGCYRTDCSRDCDRRLVDRAGSAEEDVQ